MVDIEVQPELRELRGTIVGLPRPRYAIDLCVVQGFGCIIHIVCAIIVVDLRFAFHFGRCSADSGRCVGWQGPSGNRFTVCLYRSERVRGNSLQSFPQRSSLFACRFSWIFVDGGLGGLYKWPSRRRRMRLAGRLIGRGIVGSRLGTCVQSSNRSSPTVVVVCVIKAALSFGG